MRPTERRQGTANTKILPFPISKIQSDLNSQVTDGKELSYLFDGGVIPYMKGDRATYESLLIILRKYRTISPTLGACYVSMKPYVIAKKIKIRPKTIKSIDLGNEQDPLTPEQIKKAGEFLGSIVYRNYTLDQLKSNAFDNFFDRGDIFVEIGVTTVGGISKPYIQFHPETEIKKAKGKDGKYVYLQSVDWSQSSLSSKAPRIIPMDWGVDPLDEYTVYKMIHVKNGSGHYGRPIWLGAFYSGYRQYQDQDHLLKAGDNRFTATSIIEYSGQDPEMTVKTGEADTLTSLTALIQEHFRAGSDAPKSVIVTERAYGADPITHITIPLVTNENFFKEEDNKNRRNIFENLSWSERLLGNIGGSGWLGDSYFSELSIKDDGILQTFRDFIDQVIQDSYADLYRMVYKEEVFFEVYLPKVMAGTNLTMEKMKMMMDLYGVGVRAGTITPTLSDEYFFRNLTELPDVNDEIISDWVESGKVRKPITLKEEQKIVDPNE